MSEPKPDSKSIWSDLPKLLTAVGSIIAATAALLTALHGVGVLRPKPTALPATSTPGSGAVLLEDSFRDATSGWDVGADNEAEWTYLDGEYRIAVRVPDVAVFSTPDQTYDWRDVAIVVEARRVSGPADNEYGVLARYQDRGNFYFFGLGSDGTYCVQMLRNDEWRDLVPWTESELVGQNDATNVLRVECRGANMRFYVNDKLLTVVEDYTLPSGTIGLLAGAFEEGGVVIHFDSLLVRRLEP